MWRPTADLHRSATRGLRTISTCSLRLGVGRHPRSQTRPSGLGLPCSHGRPRALARCRSPASSDVGLFHGRRCSIAGPTADLHRSATRGLRTHSHVLDGLASAATRARRRALRALASPCSHGRPRALARLLARRSVVGLFHRMRRLRRRGPRPTSIARRRALRALARCRSPASLSRPSRPTPSRPSPTSRSRPRCAARSPRACRRRRSRPARAASPSPRARRATSRSRR